MASILKGWEVRHEISDAVRTRIRLDCDGVLKCILNTQQGRKWALNIWSVYGVITQTFCALPDQPSEEATEEWMSYLEQCIVLLLHGRTSSISKVNEVRKYLIR